MIHAKLFDCNGTTLLTYCTISTLPAPPLPPGAKHEPPKILTYQPRGESKGVFGPAPRYFMHEPRHPHGYTARAAIPENAIHTKKEIIEEWENERFERYVECDPPFAIDLLTSK